MLNIRNILLPVDVPLASLSVAHQAATLARHFKSELVFLHVTNPQSDEAGVPKDSGELSRWDLFTAIMNDARKLDPTVGREFDGLTVRSRLATGEVAEAIVETAEQEKADLIMMPSFSFTFYQFLMGTVAAKVLHGTECPVWTGAHLPDSPGQKFAIRNVLAAVEFGPRAELTMSWAARLAADFGARLTLANVTASVELWGPGGSYIDEKWKVELFANASQQMTKLQRDTGITGDVLIGSGDVPTALCQIAKQTKADLLVNGCYPYGGHLRTHGYGIISAVPVPVMSV